MRSSSSASSGPPLVDDAAGDEHVHTVGAQLGEQPRVVRDREHAEIRPRASSRSTRRATSRSASTSRPESISSRIANFGCEHRELHRLGALLLAAGELVVDAARRGARRARRARAASARDRVVQTGRRRRRARASRRRRASSSGTPGTSTGYCIARNSPRCARCHVGSPRSSSPSIVTEPRGDLVVAAAHERVRQRRLARAVRAHQRVHLARAHLEVDAAQDLVAGDASRAGRRCAARDRSRQHHRSRRRRRPRPRTRAPAGSPAASAAHRSCSENVEPCFGHSISRSSSHTSPSESE